MRVLIAALLFSYPGEFRTTYGPQITRDVEDSHNRMYALRVALDILTAGFAMRAESLWRDLRFAVRVLIKAPLFTTVVITTLALAIAGNAVIFSVLNAVVLAPLPFAQAERLGIIQTVPTTGARPIFFTSPALTERRHIERSATSFSAVTTSLSTELVAATIHGKTQQLFRGAVAANYFATLGIHAQLGQLFTQGSVDKNAVVISDKLWRKQFNADASVLGQNLTIEGAVYTIRGVAPANTLDINYGSLSREDFWTLLSPSDAPAGEFFSNMTVRLKDGVTFKAAQADLDRINANTTARLLFRNRIVPLTESALGPARSFLWLIFFGVSAVLLIACANIANLLLVRGVARSAELAVRSALGASKRRISVQLLTETAVLFIAGSLLGLAIAIPALPAVAALMPGGFPRIEHSRIDAGSIAYTCLLTCVVSLLAGVAPSLWQARNEPGLALKSAGRNALDRGIRTRFVLICMEVAVAFALTVSSGLMLRTYVSLVSLDVGFSPSGVYDAPINTSGTLTSKQMKSFHVDRTLAPRIAARILRLPGVDGVGYATTVPFSKSLMMSATVHMAHGPAPARGVMDPRYTTRMSSVSPNFFALLRIPLLKGRTFTPADRGKPVAVVDEAFVKQFIPHGDPLAARIQRSGGAYIRIVGVVGNTHDSLRTKPSALWYSPFSGEEGIFQIVVRTNTAVPRLATGVASLIKEMAPRADEQPVQSLRDIINANAARERATMLLLGALAVLALVLALGGIYGIVSYSTQRRFHEIGVRMALGARSASVWRGIIGGAIAQTAIGIVAGVIIAACTTRLLGDKLNSISPIDPVTFIVTIGLFAACSVLAALIPAMRAARSDPATTLRYE